MVGFWPRGVDTVFGTGAVEAAGCHGEPLPAAGACQMMTVFVVAMLGAIGLVVGGFILAVLIRVYKEWRYGQTSTH